jgi:hypothetical protein
MKTTTKLFALVMAAAVFTLPGCSSDNNPDGPDNPDTPDTPSGGGALVVDETVTAEFPGDTYYVTVLSDVAWTATVDADAREWVSVSPAAGAAGNVSVKVIVGNNPGITNRAATITFSGGDITGTTAVTQYAVPNTFCEKCAWDESSSTWVDAYVTTYIYPFEFDTRELYLNLNLFDYSVTEEYGNYEVFVPVDNADSYKDGRANTDALVAADSQVAKECRKLGPNWYLPASEELINISNGSVNAPLNGKPGLDLLQLIQDVVELYHSSTLGVASGSTDRTMYSWGVDNYGVGNHIHVMVNKTGMILAGPNGWQVTFHAFYRE